MPPGGVDVLTRAEFDTLFALEATLEEMKDAALALGERCGCEVTFVGTDEMYVRFTRKGA
jgi:hypothetical protein